MTLPAGVTRSGAVLSRHPTTAGTVVKTTVYAYNCFNGSNTGQNDNQVVTWTIAKGNQTITFPAQAVRTYPAGSFVLNPLASSTWASPFRIHP